MEYFFIVIYNKKAEPFDAYQNFGYRQVTIQNNKHKQPTPNDESLLSACSCFDECLAVFKF